MLSKCESLLLSIIYKNEQRAAFSRATASPQPITSIPYETQANWVALLGDTPTQPLLYPSPQASSLSLVLWRKCWLWVLKPDSLSSDLGQVLCPHQASGIL